MVYRKTSSLITHVRPVATFIPESCNALARLKDVGCKSVRVAGTLPDLSRAIAVVGTRYASPEAVAYTEQLATQLVYAGCTVVSGGALGIDAAAHRGAMKAIIALGMDTPKTDKIKVSTLAVLGTGLGVAYPPQHGPLFSQIIQHGGALLTEISDDKIAPHGGLFIKRNRIIAALSKAVVVVQAPVRSGALSTARFALKYERPVWIVPGTPWDPRSAGNIALLAAHQNHGAHVLTEVDTMLVQLGLRNAECKNMSSTVFSRGSMYKGASENSVNRLVRCVSGRALEVNEIIDEIGLGMDQVQTVILDALLADKIIEVTPGRYLSKTQ